MNSENTTVPGRISRVWQTKEVDEVIEIVFDDRSSIRCTPEHLFLTRAGQWIAAENLPVGLPMMAIPRKAAGYANHIVVAVRRVKLSCPIPVFDMTVEQHHNFVLSNGIVSHNCDPGWHGSHLTLELKNWTEWHFLRIRPGMKIGQVEFSRVTPVPEHRSYSAVGSYNNAKGVALR